MAGRPGRSGGWNRLTPEQHALRGTSYRKPPVAASRALAVTMPAAAGPVPEAVVEGLDGRGLAFVQDCWRSYADWGAQSLLLLREAGLLVSQLEAQRGTPAERATQRMRRHDDSIAAGRP